MSYLWSNGNTIEDLQNIVSGNYSVSVTNSLGCSAIKTSAVAAPSCNGLSGMSVSNVNSSSAVINWNTNSCASFIKLRRKATTESIWKYVEINGTLGSKSFSNLLPGKTYEVQALSYCNSSKTDSSSYSSSVYFTTTNTCSVPSGMNVSNISSNSATVNWTGTGNPYNYKIRYAILGGHGVR